MSTTPNPLLTAVRETLVKAGFPFGRGSSAGTMLVQDAPGLFPGSRVRVEYLADYESLARLRLEAVRAEEALLAAGFRCTPSVDPGVFFALPGAA
jgi:hypothetical protein